MWFPFSLKLQCVDPRYNLVTKGVAINVEDLGGRWAVPGYDKKSYSSFESAFAANATYGQKIMSVVNKILMVPIKQPIKEIDTNIKDDENNIVNNGKLNINDQNVEENIFNDTNYDNTIPENNVVPENNVPKQYGSVEASTSGIIAAILDLLITFFTAWQSVDDEPIVEPLDNNTSNEEEVDDFKTEEQESKETIFSKFKRKSKKSKK